MTRKNEYFGSASRRLRKLAPTEVFEAYWRFATERQKIFLRRKNHESGPWTEDAILQEYKFTNAYRLLDRVSQFLICQVIGKARGDEKDLFFRILLFKLFNKIETWNFLESIVGELSWHSFDFDTYDSVLSRGLSEGRRIYSAAYIMPSGLTSFGSRRKHRNHLRLIELMMKDDLPLKLSDSPSMSDAYQLLLSYPTIGKFLAYQLVSDINYSDLTDFKENEFVVAGPGACEGIRKCFCKPDSITPEEIIRIVTDYQEMEFGQRGLHFAGISGRHLQFIDCQNLFCEIDIYSRVAFPSIKGRMSRTRIKQKFKPNSKPIQYALPAKWGGILTVES